MATYCTTAELAALTGSTLDATTVLAPIIEQAEREIDTRLAKFSLSGSSASGIKAACLKLSIAGLLTRYRLDGTQPASIKMGDYTSSDNIDQAIAKLTADAWELVDDYIQANANAADQYYLRKVNR